MFQTQGLRSGLFVAMKYYRCSGCLWQCSTIDAVAVCGNKLVQVGGVFGSLEYLLNKGSWFCGVRALYCVGQSTGLCTVWEPSCYITGDEGERLPAKL